MSLTMSDPISLDLLAKHLQAIRNELREIKYSADNDRRNVRSQFENLVATNANQLGDIEARLAARADALESLLGDRFGYLDERLGAVEERVNAVEQRLGALEERLGALEQRMTALETQGAHIANRMEHLVGLVEEALKRS